MKIGNVSFSAKSWEAFTKLTRAEQKKKVSTLDKSISDKELNNLLKNVSYGKPKKSKSKAKKNNTKQAPDRSGYVGGAVEGTEGGEN